VREGFCKRLLTLGQDFASQSSNRCRTLGRPMRLFFKNRPGSKCTPKTAGSYTLVKPENAPSRSTMYVHSLRDVRLVGCSCLHCLLYLTTLSRNGVSSQFPKSGQTPPKPTATPRKQRGARRHPISWHAWFKFKAWGLTDGCSSGIKQAFYPSDNTITLRQGQHACFVDSIT